MLSKVPAGPGRRNAESHAPELTDDFGWVRSWDECSGAQAARFRRVASTVETRYRRGAVGP
jgi:hypothetical protein